MGSQEPPLQALCQRLAIIPRVWGAGWAPRALLLLASGLVYPHSTEQRSQSKWA